MGAISGIHHVSMHCAAGEEYEKVLHFYCDVLGLTILREWEGGVMLEAGSTLLEIFPKGNGVYAMGAIRHFAFTVEDVDALASAVQAAGYEVLIAPKDVVIPSNPPLHARVAFCRGVLGEEIEFFCEQSVQT